jgi:hypothetical protein
VGVATALPDVSELSDAGRSVLAGVWAFRAGAERQAAHRFVRLARELRETSALEECVTLAERAAEDELRHVEICTTLALAYGGSTEPGAGDDAPPIGPATLSQRERLLYELVAFCCITETLNASLMKVALDRACVPEVRDALRAILRDEVQHARLGWAHLAWERSRGGASFVAERLPAMLSGAVQKELFSPNPAPAESVALERHGELPEAQRLAIFEATAAQVLVPGFEHHGIDTAPMRAWISRMK